MASGRNPGKSKLNTSSLFRVMKLLCLPFQAAYDTVRPATQLEKELKLFDSDTPPLLTELMPESQKMDEPTTPKDSLTINSLNKKT